MLKKLILTVIMGGAVSAFSEEPRPSAANPRVDAYVLNTDDQILIRAANVPEITEKTVRVDTNGFINLPTVGRVQAAGMTAEQVEAEMTKRLKVYLENPEVVVSVAEFRTQPVSVIGEVTTPGVQQI